MLPTSDLAADAVAVGAEQVGELVDAGGEDDRRREQEREPRRVLVVEAAGEAGDHRDPGAADPGEQRADLGDADDDRLPELEGVEAPTRLARVSSRGRRRVARTVGAGGAPTRRPGGSGR